MARKSGFGELCKSAASGLAAVTIVGSILWVASSWIGSMPIGGGGPRKKAAGSLVDSKPKTTALPDPTSAEEPAESPDEPAQAVAVKADEKPAEPPVAKGRTASEVLAELKRTPARKTAEGDRKRAELIGELYRADPANRQLPGLLTERWLTLRTDSTVNEERALAAQRKPGDPIGNVAAYVTTLLAIEDPAVDLKTARKAIAAFAARSKGKSPLIAETSGATWCPPCVAAMPEMKLRYEEYVPEGVVFIGVSLDDPGPAGRQKLLGFVAANDIPWAQYHQANRELSRTWGVTAIPAVFVVDQEGRVVTTRGRLDAVIPELLADAKTKKSGKGTKK